jgi:biotin synthase
MCYAIPGKIEKIERTSVVIDYFGEKRKAYNELIDLAVGEYVYAQGGFVVSRVSAAEAESVLAMWKEMFFELQEVDLRLSKLNLSSSTSVAQEAVRLLDKASQDNQLSREELKYLLAMEDPAACDLLYKTANFLRQKHLKNSCCVHGIIEISNYCRRACQYCGISTNNSGIERYRMSPEEIVAAAREASEIYGFRSLVLQSGEDPGYSVAELSRIIHQIRQTLSVLVFISFGEVGLDGLQELYQAGARGLLMRFETSNPALYRRIHPGQELDTRIAHLKKAYELGYLVLTGGLIGLPNQTPEDVLDDILLAKELHTEMFSFGPFIPHQGTPFAGMKPPADEDVIKALAVARLIDSEHAKILVTTALETLNPDTRRRGLLAGANSVMLNVTPLKYRPLYSLYPNRAHEAEEVSIQIEHTIALLRDLGRAPTDLSVN